MNMREKIVAYIRDHGPRSPRQMEKAFRNEEREARIATQELLDDGTLYLNERLKLDVSS